MFRKETAKVTYKHLLTWGAVAAVLAFVLVMGAKDTANAGTFAPTLTVTVANPEPETTSDYSVEFGIGPNDVNFAAVVAFIPPDWGVVPGDQMPVGTPVGSLQSQATLGLLNSACNQSLPVAFDFMNSSINTNETVSFLDVDEDNTADYAEDDDNDGLANAIELYPEFLNRLFESDGTPLQPIRRSAGITLVAGIPVLLQFLIFPPGTVINEDLPADPERGFPSVTVLQNAGDPDAEPQPGAITDFCAPLATQNTSLGVSSSDEGEEPLFVTPKAGTHEFSVVSFGLRDADDDGYENALDTCSQQPNTGSPKVTNDGDLDNDGLDATCDPNDDPAGGGTDSDEDADGYSNRQDNCPLDANGQAEADAGEETGNQQDTDTDQIGDACDSEPEAPSGDLGFSDIKQEIVVGGGGEGGPPACAAAGGANGANCWYDGYELDPEATGGEPGGGQEGTPTESGEATPEGSPTEPAEEPEDDDDGGSNTGVIIGVIAAIAAVAIIGGGAFMLMRRRNA
jgi:hypothetical protein